MEISFPICFCCKHFDAEHAKRTMGKRVPHRCKSFPTEIPLEVVTLQFDHRLPHPHDQGRQFEIYDNREMLDWYFDRSPDEHIKEWLQLQFDYLDNRRRHGIALPPNMESAEANFLTLVKLYNDSAEGRMRRRSLIWEGPPLDCDLLQILTKAAYDSFDEETRSKYDRILRRRGR
ncbi:MAG: hypothetical protein K8L91_24440 [Anaerolineae bacterium]|nr:hypothetical protein [Anaerolineae bacterium]